MSQNLPEDLISILQEAQLNNPEITALAKAHANPPDYVWALVNLKKEGIFTQETPTLIAQYEDTEKITYSLLLLKDAGIFSTERQAYVADPFLGCYSKASGLVDLHYADILTPQIEDLVFQNVQRVVLSHQIVELKKAGFLEPENLTLIFAHEDSSNALIFLHRLYLFGILNQANFEAVLAPNHSHLISQDFLQYFDRIPPHSMTQANLQQLITASEAPNPQQALHVVINQILGIRNEVAPQQAFNQAQSTHTASVHASVSKSAGKLMETYGGLIEGSKLDSVIGEIGTYVNSLGNSRKEQAAKRAFERLTEPQYTFTDSSGVSTRQLLALAWLAIKDDSKREGDLQDAQTSFVEGLYEIQRGYNINESGVDKNEANDLYICSPGTFNKIIEKLAGIHQDVELKFVTKEGAASKFIPLALHHSLQCLKEIASQNSAEAAQLIKDLKKAENLAPIWDRIKDKVQSELWEEFKEAYGNNLENIDFKGLIEAGIYIESPSEDKLDNTLKPSLASHGIFGHASENDEKKAPPTNEDDEKIDDPSP